MKCIVCNRETGRNNSREQVCWDCCECESVIADGVDMSDNPIPQKLFGSSAINTLQYILKRYHVGIDK